MLSHLLPTPHPLMESKFAAGISTTSLPFRASSPRPFDRGRLPEPDPYARRSNPMSIQSATRGATPPPPLPPPRYIEGLTEGQDHAWHFANASRETKKGDDMYASVAPGSSLLGGNSFRQTRPPERKVDLSPSGEYPSSTSPKSGGRIPDLAALLEYNKLQGERQLGQRNRETSSQAYDKSLLQRIGGPSTPPRSGPISPAEEAHTNGYHNNAQKLNTQLRPLSVPERRYSSTDVERPPLSANHHNSVSPNLSGLRSPLSEDGADRNGHYHRRLPTASSLLADESAARHDSANSDHHDDYPRSSPGMNSLSIDDRRYANAEDYQQSHRAGQKRRAMSPPTDHSSDSRGHSYNGPGDWSSRQLGITGSRPPQAARMQAQPSSYSASPSSIPRSVASSYSSYSTSKPSTAATSYSSDSHPSPKFHDAYPSQQQSQQKPAPPPPPPAASSHHQHSESMPPPPQTNGNRAPPVPHRRTTSSGVQRAPGLWICDCCPKKPKKFETEADLRVHEMEKQYVCQYCPNRFKNKNEAERHQNSLHLRHHSWSCAALTTFEMAFHATPQSNLPVPQPGQPLPASYPTNPSTDTCGYCGMVFKNPPNWDERVDHLNNDHKFGECNQSKKFYRADHFRQHLKHSHAGTSGKWTNMLENACMKDEPLPQPINRQ